MPTYVYEALNAAGKPEKGRIEADNSDAAMAAVRQNGFFPTTIREEKAKGSSSKAASKKEAAKKGKKKKATSRKKWPFLSYFYNKFQKLARKPKRKVLPILS